MLSSKGRIARRLLANSSYGALAAMAVLAIAGPVLAQPAAPAAADATQSTEVEGVVITGFRASVASSLEVKRRSDVMVDAITAEDIADFPDSNLAESLQRLPGVSIDRFDGEGRSITVRGLGGDFTRTRLNGLEALSTAGANESGGTVGINRSRSFDYNTFASELFSQLKVQKTSSAETDEGSLGATVDLTTGRPFNFKGQRFALSAEDAYYEAGEKNNPRFTALYSNRWADGKVGFLASAAYSERDQTIDSYSRQAAAFDYEYRGSTFAGTPNPTAAIPVVIQRQGFAAPAGTNCNGTPAGPNATGVVPGLNITYIPACDIQRGSNAAAYALVNPVIGAQRTRDPVTGAITTTTPGSLIRVPGLPTLNQQQIDQNRLGLTASLQFRPDDKVSLSIDGVYSRMAYDSQQFQIQTIGMNRNNTVTGFNTVGAGTTDATKQGFYTNISCRSNVAAIPVDCGQQFSTNGGAILPGYAISRNRNNLEAYDYYNNPLSPGFIAPSAGGIAGIAQLDKLIGRPSTRIIDAALSPAGTNADYVKLANLDWRAADDESKYTTTFHQVSFNYTQNFSDTFHMNIVAGRSISDNEGQGVLSDFIRLDANQGVAGNEYYVYDERGNPKMPIFIPGFDVANPSNWNTVKGYSVLRTFSRSVINKYDNIRADFLWDANEQFKVKAGGGFRRYKFVTTELRRLSGEQANPTLLEAGIPITQVGRIIEWGSGLDVPAGTPTSFFAPDNRAMQSVFGFNCNCINKWGDFTKSIYSSPGSNFDVTEDDTGGYGQVDYDLVLLNRPIRGNVGLRYSHTDITAHGLSTVTPFAKISNANTYEDWLPSLNVVWEVRDDLYLRGAVSKVLARPQLGLLGPGFTAISIPSDGSASGATATAGNTKLNPVRATNYDLAIEWYPMRDATFGVAIFDKEIENYQQIVVTSSSINDLLDPAGVAALRASQTTVQQQTYIDNDDPFDLKTPQDTPGGYVRGIEVNYQQNLTFLPGVLKNFGILANYTHIKSELDYIVDPGQKEIKNAAGQVTTPARPVITAKGPYLNASPDAVNFTLFYEVPKWTARVSTAYRKGYFTTYPVATGTSDPGFSDSPVINDFQGSKNTLNVDASVSYKITENFTVSLEGLNLTNQIDNRYAYVNDPVVTRYASSGRQIFMGLRAVW